MTLACAEATEPVERRSDAVLGGAAAAMENSTFLIDVRGTRASICSAVLISPRMLLTAAHCVDPVLQGSPLSVRALNKPTTMGITLADTTLVTSITRHPMWDPSVMESPWDLATLVLQIPSTVRPAPMATSLPANLVGQSLLVVGYGRVSLSEPMSSGVRRSASIAVTRVDPPTISFGNDTVGLCVGDSGGPSFLNGEVVGIHSRTDGDVACGSGADIRVDAYRSFIDAQVAANDPPLCTRDGRCGASCTSPDPDCPCIADRLCNAACASDPDCTCAADGQCVASCGASDPDCACQANGQCAAGCGTRDPDCCARDAQCDAACGMTDPDCACVADGRCVSACGASDPDCACVADGRCGAACGATDPDCCASDGQCDGACGAKDPDCACVADGVCGSGCGADDADCLGAGATCRSNDACASGVCVDERCSARCSATTTCAAGSVCDGGLCRQRSGCSVSLGPDGGWLMALWLLTRRRA